MLHCFCHQQRKALYACHVTLEYRAIRSRHFYGQFVYACMCVNVIESFQKYTSPV